nr:MAG TPA: hypothetical protein [Caudoviricetes sp.]
MIVVENCEACRRYEANKQKSPCRCWHTDKDKRLPAKADGHIISD